MSAANRWSPTWLAVIAAVLVAWLLRSAWQLHRENEALRGEAVRPESVPATPAASPDGKAGAVTLEELRVETEREIAQRRAAEARIAELQSRLATQEGEVLVSFGRIDQMGQRAGRVMRLFLDEAKRLQDAREKPGEPPSPADKAETAKAFAEFFGQLAELREIEDDPREIARFHASALRELLAFDDSTAQRAAAALEREFAQLRSQELTARYRPQTDNADWDRRRDAAVTAIAARLRPLLSGTPEQLSLLPGILNLGGGARTEIKVGPDGQGSVNMKLPLFPDLAL